MKSLFGNKKSGTASTTTTSTSRSIHSTTNEEEDDSPRHVVHGSTSTHHHHNHPSDEKQQPLIETLRSTDTISAIPSSTTTMSNDSNTTNTTSLRHSAPLPPRTNPQQMNKKLFGTRSYNAKGSSSNSHSHRNNNVTNTASHHQQRQDQSPSIGYTTSLHDHLTSSASFSTANISLMVPPSQQQQQQRRNKQLPPETIISTSQQQYTPPVLVLPIPTTTGTKDDSNSNSATLTYPRRSVDQNHTTNWSSTEHDAMNHDETLQDVALQDDEDGIDQEHYNRLLSTTHENNNNSNNHHPIMPHPSKSLDNDDDDDDDDIVPFAVCFTRPFKTVPTNNTTQHHHSSSSNNNNDASMTTVRFQNNNDDNNDNNNSTNPNEIDTKIPNKHTCYVKFQYYFVRTGLIYALIVIFTAASMLYGLSDQLSYMNRHRHHTSKEITNIQVAFIGNAYFFVNDIPRLLESISQGFIYQNSCLHAGGSLSDLWVTGNGMYKLWQTDEAIIEYTTSGSNNNDDTVTDDDVVATNDDTSMVTTYDYGYCSVLQLLQGYDKYMTYGNTYGKYYSDGLNPCIVDDTYDNFMTQQLQDDPISSSSNNYWDYIIIVEQTKRMAFAEARNETINFLMNRYGPLIKSSGAIPVLVDTHAFWSSKSNMTGLTDIPTFAALIAQGVTDFAAALASVLPSYQAPLVAPIGLAYLTVWEEDDTLWQKLFLDDGIHSSTYGSYLFACVLFATLFDQLPTHSSDDSSSSNGNSEYNSIASLFMDARKIVGQASYPTFEEAEYLRNVAGRVTLRGYVPSSLLDALSTLQDKDQAANIYNNNRRSQV